MKRKHKLKTSQSNQIVKVFPLSIDVNRQMKKKNTNKKWIKFKIKSLFNSILLPLKQPIHQLIKLCANAICQWIQQEYTSLAIMVHNSVVFFVFSVDFGFIFFIFVFLQHFDLFRNHSTNKQKTDFFSRIENQ